MGLLALGDDALELEALELARACPSWEAGSVALAAAALAHYSKEDYDAALYEIRGRSSAPLLAEVLVSQGRISEGLELMERAGGAYAWDNPGVFAALDQADRPALLEHVATLPLAEATRILGAAARDRHVQGADTQQLVAEAIRAAEQRARATGQSGPLLSLAEILGPHPGQVQALKAAHQHLADPPTAYSPAALLQGVEAKGSPVLLASAIRACAWSDPEAAAPYLAKLTDEAQREHTRAILIQAATRLGRATVATQLASECRIPELAHPWAALAQGEARVSDQSTPELCELVEGR